MAETLVFTHGVPKAVADLQAVQGRMRNLAPAYREIFRMQEKIEQRGFARLRGRYVRTRATKNSLTRRGSGAIRRAHRHGSEFGTRVWYAHFLTKAPRDTNLGQVHKSPPGKGRSAVLFFPRSLRKETARHLENYVAEPWG